MADFRKFLYALAIVAMLALATVPASAQGLVCNQPTGTNTQLRQGVWVEFAGDFVVTCNQAIIGSTTPAGQNVKLATIRLSVIGTTFTSKFVSGNTFLESLLLVDDPNQGSQLACGQNNNDTTGTTAGAGGPGTCNILSTGNPNDTYNGTAGHPNIFQGRKSANQTVCPWPTCVEFLAVPMDPPGTNGFRTFRFKNNRVDVGQKTAGTVISFRFDVDDSQTSVSLPNTKTAEVGTVIASDLGTSYAANNDYVVCSPDRGPAGTVTVSEGANSSAWRARNVVAHNTNSTLPAAPFSYNNTTNFTSLVVNDQAQNFAGGGYFTEESFVFDPAVWPSLSNGLSAAGRSTQGTQIAFRVNAVPAGVSVTWPANVNVTNASGSTVTGFLHLVQSPSSAGGIVIYEVGFDNPFVSEIAAITPTLSYSLISNGPVSMSGGSAVYAPYGETWNTSSVYDPGFVNLYPRFATMLGAGTPNTLYTINTCQCSLLFPWVVQNSGFVTGIAVSNTSSDPTNTPASFTGNLVTYQALKQNGVVRLYLFGTDAPTTAIPNPSTPKTAQTTSGVIQSGTSATFLIGGSGVVISNGFQGYAIAQADFQYCHGVAYIVPTNGTSTLSYVGLVMDNGILRSLPARTLNNGDRMQN
jgi:hypothetical protein